MSERQFKIDKDMMLTSWRINEDGSLSAGGKRPFKAETVISNIREPDSSEGISEGTIDLAMGLETFKYKVQIENIYLKGDPNANKPELRNPWGEFLGGSRRRQSPTKKKKNRRRRAKKTERKRRRQ
jgi:hypothetical protein